MAQNPKGISREELSIRLQKINLHLALCAEDEKAEFSNWAMELGQWLVEAGELGFTWTQELLGLLWDGLEDWQTAADQGAPTKLHQVTLLEIALVAAREYRHAILRHVHPGVRPQPARNWIHPNHAPRFDSRVRCVERSLGRPRPL